MEEEATLHVTKLSRTVLPAHLREIFGCYGEVTSVEVPADRRVGLPKGYAYVTFRHAKDADTAMECMNGGQVDGADIKVAHVLLGGLSMRREVAFLSSPFNTDRPQTLSHTLENRQGVRFVFLLWHPSLPQPQRPAISIS